MKWWIELGYPAFEAGPDGFPNIGEVVKHYRLLRRDEKGNLMYSQSKLASALGVDLRTIQRLENGESDLDTDKRRTLCELLKISPFLLGVVSLDQVLKFVRDKSGGGTPDLDEHRSYLEEATEQYRMASSRGIAEKNHIRMQSLYNEFLYGNSQPKRQLQELLFEYHILSSGTQSQRSQPSLNLAFMHAESALEIAPTAELKVVGMLQIGGVYKERGNIQESLAAFECVLEEDIPDYLKGIALLYCGPLRAKMAQDCDDQRAALSAIKQAENIIPSSPLFVHGFDLSEQKRQLREAETLISLGYNRKALEGLRHLECDSVGWWQLQRDLLKAQAHINLKDYPHAVNCLESATSTINTFDSDYVTHAQSLRKQLVASPYRRNSDVTRLGDMLR